MDQVLCWMLQALVQKDPEQKTQQNPSPRLLPFQVSLFLAGEQREGSTLHRPHSPFKEVAVDGWEPLQRHGVSGVAHDLGGEGNRRRLPGGLPALVHQVQVTVHSGDLIGREGVGAVVICKRAQGEIRAWLHRRAGERIMMSPGDWRASTPALANSELASSSAQELMVCEQISAVITSGDR